MVIFGAKVTKVVEGLTKAGLRHQGASGSCLLACTCRREAQLQRSGADHAVLPCAGYGPVPNAVGALPGTEAAARSVEMTEHRGALWLAALL